MARRDSPCLCVCLYAVCQRIHVRGVCREVAHYAVLLTYAFARSSKVRAALCKLGAVSVLVGWCARQLLTVVPAGSSSTRPGNAEPRCVRVGGGHRARHCCTMPVAHH